MEGARECTDGAISRSSTGGSGSGSCTDGATEPRPRDLLLPLIELLIEFATGGADIGGGDGSRVIVSTDVVSVCPLIERLIPVSASGGARA